MKHYKMTTIIPLIAALFTGTALAQGNPHQDAIAQKNTNGSSQQVAAIQGNPHLGFEVQSTMLVRYQGNPHEGYITRVEQVAATQGNPHAGFRMVPLAIASAE